jgi:acyl-CoA reductase-like NAD-dependent aldehyde dehydrogenase
LTSMSIRPKWAGGVKESGFGKENSVSGLEGYTQLTVNIRRRHIVHVAKQNLYYELALMLGSK